MSNARGARLFAGSTDSTAASFVPVGRVQKGRSPCAEGSDEGDGRIGQRAQRLAAELDVGLEEGRAHTDHLYRVLLREARALRALEDEVRSAEDGVAETLLRCADATVKDVQPEIHRLLVLRQEILERALGALVEVRGLLSPSQLARALEIAVFNPWRPGGASRVRPWPRTWTGAAA